MLSKLRSKGLRFSTSFKIIGKFLLLLIIPILLVIRLGLDAILPIIVYMQFLLIWAQAEISMRQNVLFSTQFEPLFSISIKGQTLEIEPSAQKVFYYDIRLRNISSNPAYSVGVARLLDRGYKPVSPNEWSNYVRRRETPCLSPGEEAVVCELDEELYTRIKEEEMILTFLYFNRFGDFRELFVKFFKDKSPLLMHERIERPGILLRIFEDMALLLRFYKLKIAPA